MAEVFFNGPAGRIEGKYTQSTDTKAPIALVLHPHPLHGGTMNNKVVYNLYKTLVEANFSVLRINFRGVGRSMGSFDEGVGEMMDAATALDWLQVNNPMSSSNIVAGFSFGSWIALQLIMRRPEINNFIAISPPVEKYDFSFLAPCPISGLVIQGNMDSVVAEIAVNEFAQKLSKPRSVNIDYRMIKGADHFIRNKIDNLNEEIKDYLQNNFNYQNSNDQKSFVTSSSSVKKMFLD